MQEERLWNQVANMVGAENVGFDPQPLLQRGWYGPPPKAIVHPGNREQIAEVLRLAHAERLRVAPAGHGTKQRLGGAPSGIDLILSLARLDRIPDYQPADLTVTVEAGAPMQDAGAALRAQGQMLPLDAPFASEATVGGVVATNGTGPRRLAYGSARDMVLGVHFVTAEGKLAKSGGKVVKNVAGYDIAKLLIGSLGSLGILTDITFKVFPRPPASATLKIGFPGLAQALQARQRILNSPFPLQALDLFDASAGKLLGEPPAPIAPFTLAVWSAGPQTVVERICRDLPGLIRPDGPLEVECLKGEEEEMFWSAIRELTPSFLRSEADGVVIKASVLLTQMAEVIGTARRAALQNQLESAFLARAGTGIVYGYLWARAESGDTPFLERMAHSCESILAETDRNGGRAIVEWCRANIQEKINIWGPWKEDFEAMRRLKAEFDPRGILNPGRFYGGI